jgi:hypothetical protein
MKSQINWSNKIIEIQIIISIGRVSEHFSKMLVLSGVFLNTRIFWYYELREPRLYACQLYANSCLLYALSNRQPIKTRIMFLLGYGPIAIADWSIIVQCHLFVKREFYRLLVRSLKCAYWVHWNDCLWSLESVVPRHCFLLLPISRFSVVRLTRNQVQVKERGVYIHSIPTAII